MLSKIKIAADADGKPEIRIEYKPSDDMKDDFVQRFLEGFYGGSFLACFLFQRKAEDGTVTAVIRPLSVANYPNIVQSLIEQLQETKLPEVTTDYLDSVTANLQRIKPTNLPEGALVR